MAAESYPTYLVQRCALSFSFIVGQDQNRMFFRWINQSKWIPKNSLGCSASCLAAASAIRSRGTHKKPLPVALFFYFHYLLPCVSPEPERSRNTLRPNFLFFSPFLKKIHKYVPEGMLSKSGPLAQRHRWWRRSYTSRRHRFWRLGLGLDVDMTVTWQASWRRRSWRRAWRRRSWCQALSYVWALPSFLSSSLSTAPASHHCIDLDR